MKLKKNAFRYPNDPEAVIPQQKEPVYIERRSYLIPSEYLVKEKGMKHKNRLKLENAERLSSELKKVHDKVEGNLREGEVIDLNELVDTDEFGNIKMMEDVNMDNTNKGKNKSKKMDVDHFEMNEVRNVRKTLKSKKKRKNKSHFLVNY